MARHKWNVYKRSRKGYALASQCVNCGCVKTNEKFLGQLIFRHDGTVAQASGECGKPAKAKDLYYFDQPSDKTPALSGGRTIARIRVPLRFKPPAFFPEQLISDKENGDIGPFCEKEDPEDSIKYKLDIN